MTRILFLLGLLFVPAAGAQKPRPDWLGKEPLITVGNWDSMPIFRMRAGGAALSLEEDYARQHTEEAVRKLKELGVSMAVIHFYKGFGLEAEAPHMADARKLAALLKKNGLRVGVYVGSTIGFETFLAEKPDAKQWLVPDFLGRPVIYSNHTFRRRVYFMHPGYREYMKRVLRVALQDLHADLIHFDNTSMQAAPPIFHHPLAIEDFRRHLAQKYTPEQRTARFGHAEVRYMEPPAVDRLPGAIDDPLFQEWADFRCDQLTAYYAEMEEYIRGLNPQAAVESNPHSGISGHNTVWAQGVDYPRLLSHMDIVWTEEGNQAHATPDGTVISKIRTYKMAETLNNRIFTYTGGERGGKLQMAEAMAFNRQTLGQIGDVLAGSTFPPEQKAYVTFFRQNFDVFRGVRSHPDVAVLHSYASMAYNSDLPWQSSTLAEQALIQAHVPFDIVFDAQLRDLGRYRALILPDQESLTDEQMDLIRKYVESGGGMVATEQTSFYDAWRRRRGHFGLRDLFGVDAAASRRGVRHTAGRGRAVYLPSIEPVVQKPSGAPMTSEYWKLPRNWREFIDDVEWAAKGFSLVVKGPPTLVVEPLEQNGSRLLVHLLNYDWERSASVENVEVSVRVPAGKSVRGVRLLSPDAASSPTLPVNMTGEFAAFHVPRLGIYSVAVVDLEAR